MTKATLVVYIEEPFVFAVPMQLELAIAIATSTSNGYEAIA
jgi:hypothetical protein